MANLMPCILIVLAVYGALSSVDAKLFPLAVRLPLLREPAAPGESIWPWPITFSKDSGVFALDQDKFKVQYDSTLNSCETDIIEELWDHYKNIIFPPEPISLAKPSSGSIQMNKLIFKITNKAREQGKNVKKVNCQTGYFPVIEDTATEAYEIKVDRYQTVISANTVWGLVKGLETFSQLVYTSDKNIPMIKEVKIQDAPRFYYRGALIDTARHYMPIPMIKKHLNAMMYNKFNVFHWHMTDDQSFPFQTDAYPDLYKKGAFSAEHVYSKKDVLDIIEFARVRGIRVIPEFDTPGHTYSWGLSYPDLITVCYGEGVPLKPIYGVHGAREILNPISEFTYEFMRNLLADVKSTFKDPYIHMGMDEVYYACWLSNPEIAKWMQNNNLTSIKQVEQHYCNRVLDIAKKLNYKTIVWQDVWDNNVELEADTIIEVWKTIGQSSNFTWQEHMERSTREGHKTILSAPWYLNVIKYGSDWYDYYDIDPQNFTGTPEQKELVIGGEACMWSEFVDGANSISRLWPRASSVGERLWSSSNKEYDREEAKFRLDDHRCRMLKRGIEAAPIFNSYCGSYEPYMKNNVINHPLFNYNSGHQTTTSTLISLVFSLIALAILI